MATTGSTPRTDTEQAVRSGVVVLVDARSSAERALIARWATDAHPGAELVDHDVAALGQRLRLGGDRGGWPTIVALTHGRLLGTRSM